MTADKMNHRQRWTFSSYSARTILVTIFSCLLLLGTVCNPPATVDKPASELSVKLTVIDTDDNPSEVNSSSKCNR
jgi:hypothetical protein